MSDDVRLMLPGTPDVHGRDSTRAVFVEEMTQFHIPALTIHRQDLLVQGDHAIDIGTYEETMVPRKGATIYATGRYLVVWRREAGKWRMWRYILNEFKPACWHEFTRLQFLVRSLDSFVPARLRAERLQPEPFDA